MRTIERLGCKGVGDTATRLIAIALTILFSMGTAANAVAEQKTSDKGPAESKGLAVSTPNTVPAPPEYVIGSDDVLSVVFWRERDMSSEVLVRPDGKISLPLLNDIEAAGLTPEQLRDRLADAARRFVADPAVTVLVRQINSRRAYITGQVVRPGQYPLTPGMTVLQLIAAAGGLQDFARSKEIAVLRLESGRAVSFRFNYQDIMNQKNLPQNIRLKPGDTVVVP